MADFKFPPVSGSGGGGGGATIGDLVTGGTPNSPLYVDPSGNLGQSPALTYDETAEQFASTEFRATEKLYVGTNPDLTSPYIGPVPIQQDRLLLVAPGTQVEFNANGQRIATFYNDLTLRTVQLDFGLVVGDTDGQRDIGAFDGAPLTLQRPRNIYMAGKLVIQSGLAGAAGEVTLGGGVAAINTTQVSANSLIFLSVRDPNGGTPGNLDTSIRTPGVGFTITSDSLTDTSIVQWMIVDITP